MVHPIFSPLIFTLSITLIFASLLQNGTCSPHVSQEPTCNLSQSVLEEIRSYRPIANLIIDSILSGSFRGKTYEDLGLFVDSFPNRMTGGEGLDFAIDYIASELRPVSTRVWTESVQVPYWIRGEERLEIRSPIFKNLRVLGLVPTPATPTGGLLAPVLVVRNYTELDAKKELVPGKIVVYHSGWLGSYGETVQFRASGAVSAAKYGALAALAESVTPLSLDTPHTGGTNYDDPEVTPHIPFASITREDAELLWRLQERGHNVTVWLSLEDNSTLPDTNSRNLFGELTGSSFPNEVVGLSAHIDAWDQGQGAMDDGGGVLIAVEALKLIKYLDLPPPRRSLQAIMWTAEEQGLVGVQQFVSEHRAELGNYKAVFESDSGTFKPLGLDFAGSFEAGCIVQEVLKLLEPINATEFESFESVGSDISFLISEGVPGLSLKNENEKYFRYHHSPADVLTVQDATEMDLCLALWTVAGYVLADLSVELPREVNN